MSRPFAYTPFTRAAIALELALRLCPACRAEMRALEVPREGARLPLFRVAWSCHGSATIAIGDGGRLISRAASDPCMWAVPAGVDAAIKAAAGAFECEEVFDADAAGR